MSEPKIPRGFLHYPDALAQFFEGLKEQDVEAAIGPQTKPQDVQQKLWDVLYAKGFKAKLWFSGGLGIRNILSDFWGGVVGDPLRDWRHFPAPVETDDRERIKIRKGVLVFAVADVNIGGNASHDVGARTGHLRMI